MTLGIEAGILDALLFRLSEYTTTLDIAYPGIEFTPDGNHIEAQILPNTVNQVSLGTNGYNRHEGLMQITVVWKSGAGVIAPAEIASEIVAHFKRGTAIIRNGLTVKTRPPRTTQAIPDGGWLRFSVIIPWFVDSLNPA